jgi:hypothetical protein
MFYSMRTYYFDGEVVFWGWLPEDVTVTDTHVTGRLSQENRPPAWKTPPHVALANALIEPKVVAVFTKTYGPITRTKDHISDEHHAVVGEDGMAHRVADADELRIDKALTFGYPKVEQSFSFDFHEFEARRNFIRLAWHGDLGSMRSDMLYARFQVVPGRVEKKALRTRVLWDFICVLFLIDYDAGRVRVCANRQCAAPYFLRGRTDQEFCSSRCAVAGNNARRAAKKEGGR